MPRHAPVFGEAAFPRFGLEESREGLSEGHVLVAHGRSGHSEPWGELGSIRESRLLAIEQSPTPRWV